MKRLFVFAAVFVAVCLPQTSRAQSSETPTPGNLVETFKDWRVECNYVAAAAKKDDKKKKDAKKEEAKKPEFRQFCSAFQVYNNNKSGNELVRFIVSYTGTEKRTLISGMRTLVDVSFENNPRLYDDEKELIKGQFVRCAGKYCFARFDFGKKQREALLKAKKPNFTYPLSSGRSIRITMSTSGLSDALASLKSKEEKKK